MDDLLLASTLQPPSAAVPLHLVSNASTLPEALPLLECVKIVLGVTVAWIAFSDGTQPCYVANANATVVSGLLSDVALLAVASDGDALAIVADAALDSRFMASAWVTAPSGIHFFAGAPILLGHHERAGTLCVADNKAHSLDISQARKLVARTRIYNCDSGHCNSALRPRWRRGPARWRKCRSR